MEKNNKGWLFTQEELDACLKPVDYSKLIIFPHAKNDNEKLFNLQYEFLVNKNTDAWEKLWLLTYRIAGNLMRKLYYSRGIRIAEDEFVDRQIYACEYLLRRYKTTRGYYVRNNFVNTIKDAVRHAVDYDTQKLETANLVFTGDYNYLDSDEEKKKLLQSFEKKEEEE